MNGKIAIGALALVATLFVAPGAMALYANASAGASCYADASQGYTWTGSASFAASAGGAALDLLGQAEAHGQAGSHAYVGMPTVYDADTANNGLGGSAFDASASGSTSGYNLLPGTIAYAEAYASATALAQVPRTAQDQAQDTCA